MSNLTIFIVGIVVTLITGMGVITSGVYLGYRRELDKNLKRQKQNIITASL